MKVTCEYMMTSSDQVLWNFSRLCGPIYFVQLIFLKLKVQHILLLQLLREFSSTCCKNFPKRTGLIWPTKHILAWYKISSNPLKLIKLHEIMKIPKIHNDVLEFIWINPDSFKIFLCCNHITRNMRMFHVWNFRKMYWSVFCFAYCAKLLLGK